MADFDALQLVSEAVSTILGREFIASQSLGDHLRDVGLDSARSMELLCILEERMQTKVSDSELMRIETIGELVALVKRCHY